MDEEKGLKKILKWAGIVALITVPVFVMLQSRKNHQHETSQDDDGDIFSTELED